ncbi:MAG: insulinase family protein, partial [Deltaproteobacteria bacterium]|nr:insulinase family protein [Deltaproteobacteria bacterium]
MSKRSWGVIVMLMVAAACGTLIKPPDPDRRLDIRSAGTTFDADRGYKFVVLPEEDANVVRIDVRYQVGSIDDPIGKEGLAHLVEHLLTVVEVTRDGVKTSLDGELGRVALSYNARTEYEATVYEALALPAAVPDVLRAEAE